MEKLLLRTLTNQDFEILVQPDAVLTPQGTSDQETTGTDQVPSSAILISPGPPMIDRYSIELMLGNE